MRSSDDCLKGCHVIDAADESVVAVVNINDFSSAKSERGQGAMYENEM